MADAATDRRIGEAVEAAEAAARAQGLGRNNHTGPSAAAAHSRFLLHEHERLMRALWRGAAEAGERARERAQTGAGAGARAGAGLAASSHSLPPHLAAILAASPGAGPIEGAEPPAASLALSRWLQGSSATLASLGLPPGHQPTLASYGRGADAGAAAFAMGALPPAPATAALPFDSAGQAHRAREMQADDGLGSRWVCRGCRRGWAGPPRASRLASPLASPRASWH